MSSSPTLHKQLITFGVHRSILSHSGESAGALITCYSQDVFLLACLSQLYIYIYICVCVYRSMYVCMHACMYVCVHVCMYGTYVRACVRMYVCMYVHTPRYTKHILCEHGKFCLRKSIWQFFEHRLLAAGGLCQ